MKYKFDQMTSDFKCKHCHQYISTDPALSGVNNRNHCPYCLYSRHLDLFEAGDRLSACKGEMRPVGVTLKQARKKYGRQQGELMLVHQCVDCGKVSINRIAADDIAENMLSVYHASLHLDSATRTTIEENGVQLLAASDIAIVSARLFGWQSAPMLNFA
jgi:predicted RNA-binding Zn-ribbon protein involved in translation (DUF1610 family)